MDSSSTLINNEGKVYGVGTVLRLFLRSSLVAQVPATGGSAMG